MGHVVDFFEAEVSAITLAELTYRALTADDLTRPKHIDTLSVVQSNWDPLPVDGSVAREFARLAAAVRSTDERLSVLAVMVAATAVANWISLVTRDRAYCALRRFGLRVIDI